MQVLVPLVNEHTNNMPPCQGANKFSAEGAGRFGVLVTIGGNMGSLGNLGADPGGMVLGR
jgi:hypothetical protein